MIDWSSVFDEAYPVAGASTADINRFVATVGQPLSQDEIDEINRFQATHFDPSWRRFDPSLWVIPNRALPSSYLEFLQWCNGGEFRAGERWFQFRPALDPNFGVRTCLLAYYLPQYMPGALPFAMNGGGMFYLFDMRQPEQRGEYPIVCSHSNCLGWDADDCVQIAQSFEDACRGVIDVDDLMHSRSKG
jgi:hypothetical protein